MEAFKSAGSEAGEGQEVSCRQALWLSNVLESLSISEPEPSKVAKVAIVFMETTSKVINF